MNGTRRLFLRLVGGAAVVPAAVALCDLKPGDAITIAARNAINPRQSPDRTIYLAFLRLGLICPGDTIAQADYIFASSIMRTAGRDMDDEELAKMICPYYFVGKESLRHEGWADSPSLKAGDVWTADLGNGRMVGGKV